MIKQVGNHTFRYQTNLRDQEAAPPSGKLDYLFMMHPDEAIENHIRSSYRGLAIAIQPIAQVEWEFESLALIDWGDSLDLAKSIVMVGSSLGGAPNAYDNVGLEPAIEERSTSGIQLFAQVQLRISLEKQAELHFVKQINALTNDPRIRPRLQDNPWFIQGLFFRPDSGLFYRFDLAAQDFRPLVPMSEA